MGIMILGAVIFAILCALVAGSKNRDRVGWAILGCLLGIFALLILVCLPKKELTKPPH
jgi:uncharacterized membrane protein YeiH